MSEVRSGQGPCLPLRLDAIFKIDTACGTDRTTFGSEGCNGWCPENALTRPEIVDTGTQAGCSEWTDARRLLCIGINDRSHLEWDGMERATIGDLRYGARERGRTRCGRSILPHHQIHGCLEVPRNSHLHGLDREPFSLEVRQIIKLSHVVTQTRGTRSISSIRKASFLRE